MMLCAYSRSDSLGYIAALMLLGLTDEQHWTRVVVYSSSLVPVGVENGG
jgi:hypothetical protein